MAEKLKYHLSKEAVREIASSVERVYGRFNSKKLVCLATKGLADLELFDRARHIARALRDGLPDGFATAVAVLVAALGPPREQPGYGSYANLRVLPFTTFVSLYGLNEPEVALPALREMTRRFTSEFDIRPFIVAHRTLALETLRQWALDPDVHVRRLVSEGTRPRLPWAQHLQMFKDDPIPLLGLLRLLRDDPERYVQKSVANNLMDILKDNPGPAYSMLDKWAVDASPSSRWIIFHTLQKRSRSCSKARDVLGKLGVKLMVKSAEGRARRGDVKSTPG